MSKNTGFNALHQAAEDPAWRALMDQAEATSPVKSGLDPSIYAAVFGSEAGQMVLMDMYNTYVNVTRCVPGQGAEAAFYREGMAQVVFDIEHKLTQAEEGI